jgi:P4 family phage/plasmid primase-like protien
MTTPPNPSPHYQLSAQDIEDVFLDEAPRGAAVRPLADTTPVVAVITDLHEARQRRVAREAKPQKGKSGPSVDLLFVQHLDRINHRIGGAIEDQCDTGIYRWKADAAQGSYWEAQPEHVLEDEAWRFLVNAASDKATARKASDLVAAWRKAWAADQAQALPRLADRMIVPVLDAYLEIEASGIVAHPPHQRFGMTHAIPVRAGITFGPSPQPYQPRPLPENSLFRRYLERVQPDEGVRGILQEAMGMSLLTNPSTNFQRAVWLQGDGGNGKSVMLDILRRFHPQSTAFDLANLDQRFGLACIKDKTLVVVAETPPRGFDENRFKSLIGRDLITAERKHQDTFSFVPKATWVLAMNQTPAIRDSSHGFWRRVLPIPFDVQIPSHEMDRNLLSNILNSPAELAAVLDWMLEGAVRLLQRGDFPTMDQMPARIRELARLQRAEADSAVAFMEDFPAEIDPRRFYDKQAIYEEYAQFCQANGRHAQSSQRFWLEVRRRFPKEAFAETQYTGVDRKRRRAVNVRFDGLAVYDFANPSAPPLPPVIKKPVVTPPVVEASKVEAAPAEPVVPARPHLTLVSPSAPSDQPTPPFWDPDDPFANVPMPDVGGPP